MAKQKVIAVEQRERQIENLSFYAFGRIEREIEEIASRCGISKGEFTSRVSALFPAPMDGQVLESQEDHLPGLPENTPRLLAMGKPALALASDAPKERVHHEGPSPQVKGQRNRQMIFAILAVLTPPVEAMYLRRKMQKETGMAYATAHGHIERLIVDHVIQKNSKGEILWDPEAIRQEAAGQVNHAPQIVEKRKYKPRETSPEDAGVKLPAGETTKLLLKFIKGKTMPNKDIIQAMKKKYPHVNIYAWNATVTNLVRRGVLSRTAEGLVSGSALS